MADQIAELYVAVKADLTQLQEDFKTLKKDADSASKGISSGINKNTKQLSNSFVNAKGNIKQFSGQLLSAVGATGKFGNILGNLGQSLLQGGAVGAGFAAASLAVNLLVEDFAKWKGAINKAVTEMTTLKNATDIKFEVDAGELDNVIGAIDATIQGANAVKNMSGTYTAIAEEVARMFGTSLYLTEEQMNELTVSKEALDVLKQMRAEEEARLAVKELYTKQGKKELNELEKNLNTLTENRKRRGEIFNEQQKLLAGHTAEEQQLIRQGDAYRLLSAENKSLVDAANSLLGIEKETTKEKTKQLTEQEKIRQRVNKVKDDLNKIRADNLDVNTILSDTSLSQLPEKFKQWKEDNKEEFTIDTIMQPVPVPDRPTIDEEGQNQFGVDPAVWAETEQWQKVLMAGNDELVSQYGDLFDAVNTFGGAFGEQTAAYKAAAVIEATVATYLAATKALATVPFPFNFVAAAAVTTAGLANVANILSAAQGGTFQNGRKIASFANGGSFTVPQGFPRDSFPMMVQSGERVQVTPAGRSDDSWRIIGGKLDALNKNLAMKNMTANVAIDFDGKKLVKRVTKPNENNLRRTGINLDVL